ADAPAVDSILAEIWDHDPEMRHVYEYHKNWQDPPTSLIRQTLVAESQGQVIGVGTIFESTYSPHVLFLSIHVTPSLQRKGVGTTLYNALVALGDARPSTVKMNRKDVAGMSFLAKHEFSPAVNTLRGVIDPSTESVKDWLSTLPSEVDGFVVENLDDPNCKTTSLEAAKMHFRVYQQYHAWSPPAVPNDERALVWFLGEAVSGTNLCAYWHGELIGAANLIATPFGSDGSEAYLVWIGVLENLGLDTETLTAVLIRRLIEIADRLGLKVRFEADNTYVPHRKILEQAPTNEGDNDFIAMMDGKVA
ncbi:MAG: GNAT family N-acetyltransferase, partial [Chloroflexia bacterium]